MDHILHIMYDISQGMRALRAAFDSARFEYEPFELSWDETRERVTRDPFVDELSRDFPGRFCRVGGSGTRQL